MNYKKNTANPTFLTVNLTWGANPVMEAHRGPRFMAVCGFVACLMGRYRGDEHGKVSQGAFLDCSRCAILTETRLEREGSPYTMSWRRPRRRFLLSAVIEKETVP